MKIVWTSGREDIKKVVDRTIEELSKNNLPYTVGEEEGCFFLNIPPEHSHLLVIEMNKIPLTLPLFRDATFKFGNNMGYMTTGLRVGKKRVQGPSVPIMTGARGATEPGYFSDYYFLYHVSYPNELLAEIPSLEYAKRVMNYLDQRKADDLDDPMEEHRPQARDML